MQQSQILVQLNQHPLSILRGSKRPAFSGERPRATSTLHGDVLQDGFVCVLGKGKATANLAAVTFHVKKL